MIKQIQIQNFKCFQHLSTFTFSRINLLTGINGRGKSTLLQSLIILAQSSWQSNLFENLIIEGDLIKLGNYDDIKNSETPRNEPISFLISTDMNSISNVAFQYSENISDPLLAQAKSIVVHNNSDNTYVNIIDRGTPVYGESINIHLDLLSIFNNIHYVSADRLGPVKFVEKVNLPKFRSVGSRGENTINLLSYFSKNQVHKNLYLGKDAITLIQQTQEWLSYILGGAKLEIKGQDKESSVLYMLINSRKNSYNYKPNNVGFGYSYILPLIVTGLIAKPGETIVIENPEAHLHPRAQSRITEFFSKVASCGVQVFIESHSEHILNSLRVCALNPEVKIANSDISITYFDESYGNLSLNVDTNGKIENWPEGFFDQQEIDLADIFKFNTKRI
jgi:predicted ATPase